MTNPPEQPSDNSARESGWKEYLKIAASGFAIIFLSYFNYLQFNDYPVASAESVIVLLSILTLSLLAALFYRAQGVIGRAVLEGLLIFFVLEQNYPSGPVAMGVAGGVILLALVRKRGGLQFFGIAATFAIFAGMLVPTGDNPVGPASTAKAAAATMADPSDGEAKAPAILHIILDEHIGIEGLPAGNPRSGAMKARLKGFYTDHGFRLYGRAYAEHMHTVNSIPQMLNFGKLQPVPEKPQDGTVLQNNAYFDALGDRAYKIHVLQSSFVDYCDNAHVVRCRTYGQSSLTSMQQSPVTTAQRAQLIALGFVQLSPTAKSIGALYLYATHRLAGKGVVVPRFGLNSEGRLSTLNALLAMDGLVKDLRQARPGEAYFAHLLVPHYPYVAGEDCSIKPVSKWMLRRSMESRQSRQDEYFDQLVCVTSKLDAAIAALKMSAARDDYVVVVHGDHGSRITRLDPTVDNRDSIRDDDLIAAFSTLFAVYAPGLEPGYDAGAVPVSILLKTLSDSRFHEVPGAGSNSGEDRAHNIVLDNDNWVPGRTHSLPGYWSAEEKTGG